MSVLKKLTGFVVAAMIASACECGGSGPYEIFFSSPPRTTTAGKLGKIKVGVQTPGGQPNTLSGVPITIAIASNPEGATLAGTLTATSENGVAVFDDLSITRAGTGFTLSASAPNTAPVSSIAFDIGAATATALELRVQPTDGNAGGLIGPSPQVGFLDAYGNQASSTATITAALGANPNGATLTGTTTLVSTGATVPFTELSLDKPGTGYTLVFSAPGLGQVTSSAFQIHPGLASTLAFSVQPANAVAGAAITPAVAVQLLDPLGNVVDDSATTVTLLLSGGASGAVLTGGSAVTSHGVATFSTLAVDLAGTGYRVTAEAAGLTSAQSNTFDVGAGAASKLAFTVQPADANPGAVIAPSVKVALLDAQGNPTTAVAPVTIALAANPGSATLGGTLTRTSVAGVATFDDLTVSAAGNNYTLQVTSPGLTSATSDSFLVYASPPTALLFVTQPTQAATGGTISPAVTVKVVDGTGTLVPSNQIQVSMAIGTNPGGGTLGGTLTRKTSAGIATFDDLRITAPGTGYTLQATRSGLTSATSAAFDIRPPVLVYTDPPAGGKVRLVRNAASTNTTVVLDVVVNQAMSGYSVGFDLPVDPTRVALNATPLVAGTALNPGTAPVAAKAVLPTSGPFAATLVSGLTQKAAGTGAVTTDASLTPGALLYQVQLDLHAGAQAGQVFDGTTALPAGFKAALRDRQGNDVASAVDFAIGRLEVN